MALPLPADFMGRYYSLSTRLVDNGASTAVEPYWAAGIPCPVGTPVYAIKSGSVAATGTDSTGSKYLLLKTVFAGQEIVVVYRNLNKFVVTKRGLKTAEVDVVEGQVLAESGKSGTVSPHLEIGAYRGWEKLDPLGYKSSSLAVFPPEKLWTRLSMTSGA